MKKKSILLALVALLLASLACQTIMGGGNGPAFPGSGSDAPTAPPSTGDGGSITVGGEAPFPVTGDAFNVVSTSESVTYQTQLSSDDVVKFYQDEFGKLGYSEDKSMAVNFGGAFTMGFDGHESGRKIVIGGAAVGDGSTSVTIVLQ
jgi:hypothetical protein